MSRPPSSPQSCTAPLRSRASSTALEAQSSCFKRSSALENIPFLTWWRCQRLLKACICWLQWQFLLSFPPPISMVMHEQKRSWLSTPELFLQGWLLKTNKRKHFLSKLSISDIEGQWEIIRPELWCLRTRLLMEQIKWFNDLMTSSSVFPKWNITLFTLSCASQPVPSPKNP